MMTPEEFRQQFSIFPDTAYCASCSQGALSYRVQSAIEAFLQGWSQEGAQWDRWMEAVERARSLFARLIHASPDDIAVVGSASEAAYQVISSLPDRGRGEVVSSRLEFPSIAQVWLNNASGSVHFADENGLEVRAEQYARCLSEKTGLVSVPLVSYKNGFRPPVQEIVDMAHQWDSPVVVDAYQGIGVVPVDVRALDCDFLVAGSLKYLLGTGGVAFLYVSPRWRERMRPRLTGWFGRTNPFAFNPELVDFHASARRFEAGTPAVMAATAAVSALELINELDAEAVVRHVQGLVNRLRDALEARKMRTLGGPAVGSWGPMLAIAVDDVMDFDRHLRSHGIVASPRGSAVRLSFHYYNAASDIARIERALDEWVHRPPTI
ncbi:MAG: aminotransferase class V-fold PLP-dependent enzyme [Firmicutes bacterium]|nr:aminotransferase class V-fold PLP-dependent enzyme [Bacillota bacterium]